MTPTFPRSSRRSKSRRSRSGSHRVWWFAAAAVAALAVVSGANPPSAAPPSQPPAPPPASSTSTAPPAAESPLDEPLRLIAEARKAYQEVKDYKCTFIKRERINAKLEPENIVAMQFRAKPFSVFLDWQAPRDVVGTQACYVAGRYDGRMRVHTTGVAGLLGFVSIDLNDSQVMEHSRHAITEAGFGNLIDRFGHCWETAKKKSKAEVKIATYEYNHRRCTRIETTYPDPKTAPDSVWRSVLYLDKETHLPVRCECYDFPRDGAKEGELIEMYSFVNVQLNAGLPDDVFKH
jgi:hypothetical protein